MHQFLKISEIFSQPKKVFKAKHLEIEMKENKTWVKTTVLANIVIPTSLVFYFMQRRKPFVLIQTTLT